MSLHHPAPSPSESEYVPLPVCYTTSLLLIDSLFYQILLGQLAGTASIISPAGMDERK